jgi:hypothetical protein
MTIKTLESWCRAKGYQGGTIFMMLEDIEAQSRNGQVDKQSDCYRWGVREANGFEHGHNVASYSVPVNSWCDNAADIRSRCTIEYLCGLNDTLNQILLAATA